MSFSSRKVLALIPARGGSKRLPRKNVLPIAGKPMIAWTIEAALAAQTVDRVILSSDDPEIISVAKEWGCEVPFVRPPELATDEASSMDVIAHALEEAHEEFDDLVLLQPTSPLRIANDIDACVMMRAETGALAVVSVTALPKPAAYFGHLDSGSHFVRSNIFSVNPETVHNLNGAVYVADIARLKKAETFYDQTTRGWPMPENRSIDIDVLLDFKIAEAILADRSARK